jgi:hypothetical protein
MRATFLVTVITISLFLSSAAPLVQSKTVSTFSPKLEGFLQKPAWEIGDWWILKVNKHAIWIAVGDPPWIETLWKFEVIGTIEIEGQECFIITVAEYPTPARATPYLALYFQKENLALIRADEYPRWRPWEERVFVKEFISDVPSPITVWETTVPIDFPVFPLIPGTSYSSAYLERMRGSEGFLRDGSQTTSLGTCSIDGENLPCYEVALGGNVRQYWHPSAPWWLYEEGYAVMAQLVDHSWRSPKGRMTCASPSTSFQPYEATLENSLGAGSDPVVNIRPWSGYWWPVRRGELALGYDRDNDGDLDPPGPMEKYDQYCVAKGMPNPGAKTGS